MEPAVDPTSFAFKHVGLLKKFECSNKKNRRRLISGCDQEQIVALCECMHNILKGSVKPSEVQRKRLRKHLHVLCNLSKPFIYWTKKRDYLKKEKGRKILTTVLGVVLPALESYLESKEDGEEEIDE